MKILKIIKESLPQNLEDIQKYDIEIQEMLRIESWRNFSLPKDIFDLSFMFVQTKWNFVLCLIYRYVSLNYI